jgi:hypothetical protein
MTDLYRGVDFTRDIGNEGLSPEQFLNKYFPKSKRAKAIGGHALRWVMLPSGRREDIITIEFVQVLEPEVPFNFSELGYSGRFSRITYPRGSSGYNHLPAEDEDIIGVVFAAARDVPEMAPLVAEQAGLEFDMRARRATAFAGIIDCAMS